MSQLDERLWPCARAAESPKARVNSRCKILVSRDPLEQTCEQLSFGQAQRGTKRLAVLARDPPDIPQGIATGIGQVQGMRASVARSLPSLEQAALFELIEHQYEPAGEHSKSLAKLVLAQPARARNDFQDASVRRSQIQGSQPLCE
jgi:hypothetical protein